MILDEKPSYETVVKIKYIAKLQDGTIFEKKGYEGDEHFQFEVDEEQVISGLDKALESMTTEGVSLITIRPEYSFGILKPRGI